jgi:uroporphyrinogen decarboxylase
MGSQGFACDNDVREYFHMDKILQRVDINMLFDPMFEPYTIAETDESLKYFDVDGAVRIFDKKCATIPTVLENPVKDWDSWNKLKNERLSLARLMDRFGADWAEKVREYRNRDYPLTFNGYPFGFFGALAHLMGYENLFCSYYEEPELVHDIINHLTTLWINMFEVVLADVEVDACNIWEDISYGAGCMVSLDTMNTFMKPYYLRLTSFLKEHGVKVIFVDTDGDCSSIIPFFMECGANGLYPCETNCGMDVVKLRKMYPDLIIGGGISHEIISAGKQAIDKEIERITPVIKGGKYIPFGDHFIPPDVHFAEFKYYRERLNEVIDSCGI